MKQQNWLNENIKPLLALIIVIVGFAYFYMCSIREIKPDPQILIAFVSTISLVTGYFYGSSSAQTKKDEAANIAAPVVNQADTVNVGQTTNK